MDNYKIVEIKIL